MNRTCAGPSWLQNYLSALDEAPAFITDLITSEPEAESFRFGNGGTTPSTERYGVYLGSSVMVI